MKRARRPGACLSATLTPIDFWCEVRRLGATVNYDSIREREYIETPTGRIYNEPDGGNVSEHKNAWRKEP